MTIDFWYALQHRRLRERFAWRTIERHEKAIVTAMRARRERILSDEAKPTRARQDGQEKENPV